MQITTATPANGSSFNDLFKPMGIPAAQPVKPAESGSNGPTGPSVGGAGSQASANGTVSQEQVFSGIKHTEISTVTGSGDPNQAGAATGPSVSVGGMLQADLVVNLMDAVLPAILVAGFYAAGVKLRKSELQLTQQEKNTIIPVMQKCLDTLLINANNPWNLLAITMAVIYGGKIMEKGGIAWIEAKQEKKQQEALDKLKKKQDIAENPAEYDIANQSAADIQEGKVTLPGEEFSDAEIKAVVKAKKMSREQAKKWLRKQQGK
jgi:hypothetical protein